MVLSFEGVFKEYGREAPGVAGVSFALGNGEFAALAGPSGSGKTTLLNLAAGLDTPTRGRVSLLGYDLGALPPASRARLRRKSLGFIFQAYNLFPVLTVLENVEYPLALRGWSPKKRREAAVSALGAVGLEGLHHRRPGDLSGGQQQRVAVARAVVGEPRLVLADEPTANLDSRNAARLMELFLQLNRARGITFLFSSHDPQVLRHARRVLEVLDGTLSRDTALAASAVAPALLRVL